MQEHHLFEYAFIRIVPKVEREEFLNVGVIMLCSPQKFLRCHITLEESRLKALWYSIEIDVLQEHIHSFERICLGGASAGPIGLLSLSERFRWLTATRSTIIQTSRVHPGLCQDAQTTLDRLVREHVVRD